MNVYIYSHILNLYKQTFPMIGEYCWLHTFNPISGWIFLCHLPRKIIVDISPIKS